MHISYPITKYSVEEDSISVSKGKILERLVNGRAANKRRQYWVDWLFDCSEDAEHLRSSQYNHIPGEKSSYYYQKAEEFHPKSTFSHCVMLKLTILLNRKILNTAFQLIVQIWTMYSGKYLKNRHSNDIMRITSN